jgi:hypothetical protein
MRSEKNYLLSKLNNELFASYNSYQESLKLFYTKYNDKNIKQNTDLKDLILDYLNFKLDNGEKWIKGLIYIIKKNHFLSQNILSTIFYLDIYNIIIKPKCFNFNIKQKLYPQSKIFSYEIFDKKNLEENNNIDEETKKYKIKRQESYELFDVIRTQLEYKENPFNIVINNFILFFIEEIRNKNIYLDKIKNKEGFENYCGKVLDELKEQINEFITFLTKCITIFYRINNIQEYDTYYALLISIIFNGKGNSKKLYYLFMQLINKKERNKNALFKNIIMNYQNKDNISPKDFLIEKKFCLDNDSIELINENKLIARKIPYEKTINEFKNIEVYQNPFDKLLLTVKLSKIIQEEISNFWSQIKEKEIKEKNINLNIEADDFINIFKYMLIKSGITNIHNEICFIECFTSNQIKSDSDWYYLSLIQVSLMQLEEINNK